MLVQIMSTFTCPGLRLAWLQPKVPLKGQPSPSKLKGHYTTSPFSWTSECMPDRSLAKSIPLFSTLSTIIIIQVLATDYSHETKPGTTARTKEESVRVCRTRLGQVYKRDWN